jgi:glycosyltransferase involved in cell wall biosynthesis
MKDETEKGTIFLSIVAPAFNEAENLPQLIRESAEAGDAIGEKYEIIIVNDASTDGTSGVLDRMLDDFQQLRVLDMSRRSGQTAALDAGLRAACGKYIATLDSDLQNDPRDIPDLLEPVVRDECDLVNGWRKDRQDTSFRRLVSRHGNAYRNWMTRETIRDSGCGLKVFRRECIERMKLFDGGHRFFATLVRMDGWRVDEMEVSHRPRVAGRGKYGFFDRFFKVLRDAVAVRWMQDRIVVWRAGERGTKKGGKASKGL